MAYLLGATPSYRYARSLCVVAVNVNAPEKNGTRPQLRVPFFASGEDRVALPGSGVHAFIVASRVGNWQPSFH